MDDIFIAFGLGFGIGWVAADLAAYIRLRKYTKFKK